jgi:2-keto-4-pentenoate hydratase/2-oxohepta-3-ene-1,7-dioic acid hydratase in catechol pathway
MKLARFSLDGGLPRLGLVRGDAITDLTARIANLPATMQMLIEQWDEFAAVIAGLSTATDHALCDVKLLVPVERPGKILGIGLNYADHVREGGAQLPDKQMWFSKPATALAGPFDAIENPVVTNALDYEAELVFIIGKRCRHVPEKHAHKVIFGYCAGNDVSVRDWQFHSTQVMIGKSFDTHAPFGPYIVTPDEIDVDNLAIRCFVNDELRQQSNTRHLIFKPAAQVAYLSQAMTLEPGDVIYTGTPGGVGGTMKPPQYLKAGDRVRVEIDGIGVIDNTISDEVPADVDWS